MVAQGWCPSTYRIYPAPDGGLARIKVPGGVLTLAQLRAVANAAHRCGNGIVELTRRANLQLRGIDPIEAPRLRALLAPVGLSGPSAAIEDRRNVLASPTAGLADDEVLDVRPLVATVVAALDATAATDAPPHKFGVLVDGGGHPTLRSLAMDLCLGAVRNHDESKIEFEIALGSSLDECTTRWRIDATDAPKIVAGALALCASPPDGGPARRMAAVVLDCGDTRVLAELARTVDLAGPGSHNADTVRTSVPTTLPGQQLGGWIEARPDDALDGTTLDALANALTGIAEGIRLTPWRSVIVPCDRRHDPAGADALTDRIVRAGWKTGQSERRTEHDREREHAST